MGQPLKKLTIRGFKSIEALEDFKFHKLNVLIGANGAGKSNFVDFFRMLRALADEAFKGFVENQGSDGLFYMGPKATPLIKARLEFGYNVYEFDLAPRARGGILINQERIQYTRGGGMNVIASGLAESALPAVRNAAGLYGPRGPAFYVYDAVSSWTVYHVHDTGPLAPMRRDHSVRDYERLRHDASNLAAFLLRLRQKHEGTYTLIRDTVRLIAPFFDDFLLRPEESGPDEVVRLEWRQRSSDFPFQPHQLSDGTIRFIALTTALLQPNPPATILIDEPELGLHPYALSVLAQLIQSAAERTQVVISTQSPTLLDHFEPENIVVVNRRDGRSTFERLDPDALALWLDEYSVGEIWQKNVVQGGPVNE